MSISGGRVTEPRRAGWIRTGRWVTLATLAATAVVWAGVFLMRLADVRSDDLSGIDLLVYRAGGHAALMGHSLYAPDFAVVNKSPSGLAFTYPPFSALTFIPLAIVPVGVAKVLMVVLNAAACTVFFIVILVATQDKWERLRGWRSLTAPISAKTATVVFAAAVIFVRSVPIQHNFGYGQINLILAAAIALDILPPRVPWPRGLLVGVAVAVKLTPAVFIGYFVITRQWRAVAVSLASAISATAVGWLVNPSDTVRYVTLLAFEPARIGGLAYASNQSFRGIIERIPALDNMRGVIWVLATVLVVALACVAIEVSRRRGDAVAAMLSASFIGLLCSPVSWGHHWVWLSATAVYLLMRWAAAGGVCILVAGLAVAMVTLAAPWTYLPNSDLRERLWSPSEHLLGSVWALTGLILLVGFVFARRAPSVAAASNGYDQKEHAVNSVTPLSSD